MRVCVCVGGVVCYWPHIHCIFNVFVHLVLCVCQDVCDKLVVLMWTDWSPEVRDMAAEALGKLGKGKVRGHLLYM